MTRIITDERRMALGTFAVDHLITLLARSTQLHPLARDPKRNSIRRINNIAYTPQGHPDQLLDLYFPETCTAENPSPHPIVLYMHGGSFRLLSKDTHWLPGQEFARKGFIVANINYRKVGTDPFPACLMDCCDAIHWLIANAKQYGLDLNRLVLAGESAGAHLATALTICMVSERPELWAKRLFETGVFPKAVLPAMGILQLSNTKRLSERRPLPWWIDDRLKEIESSVLNKMDKDNLTELVDPLLLIEQGLQLERPLPAFHVCVGSRDPVRPDSERLARAIETHGGDATLSIYAKEGHAFHMLPWRTQALPCWDEMTSFAKAAIHPDTDALDSHKI